MGDDCVVGWAWWSEGGMEEDRPGKQTEGEWERGRRNYIHLYVEMGKAREGDRQREAETGEGHQVETGREEKRER